MKKIALISLGCVKNQVDSEAILALFKEPDFKIVNNLEESDVVIINTCGFIASAKEEGIDTILSAIEYNKTLVVCGCLVERYYKELKAAIPEVKLWIKFKDEYQFLPSMIQELFEDEKVTSKFNIFDRITADSSYFSYIKISEGCDNFCAFCAIPFIRGRFVSLPEDDIVAYANKVVKKGAKEIVLIGQDPTSYGRDLKDQNINLVHLLKRIEPIEGLEKIRMLYLYPDGITDELIDFVKTHKKMSHYFDIPIQHCSDNILKLMNRRDTKASTEEVLDKIKKEIPDTILRTTLIVGFPGETVKEFNELKRFIEKYKFNHLGVFTYSREKGTKAAILPHQVQERTKVKRKDEIMQLQARISYDLNKNMIGREFDAIVFKVNKNDYSVRCDYNAPDDIDGNVILKTEKVHKIGDSVRIKIEKAFVYDLIASEL
ncbi:MAG: 30S ribosomal protein S12 methylthiotransferase RimO [Bacilli bacterium]|nr:30S ribosomal protein S12 methylthiotransferase RimO [Bacilli bacterium]